MKILIILGKGLAGESATRGENQVATGRFPVAADYHCDGELRFAPFVPTTYIRVPHALNMWGYARI
jgi:hypothetical protein